MKRKAGESLTEVPVSAKRRNNLSDNSDEELRRLFKHAESNRMHYHNKISLENDEQRQARLAKIRRQLSKTEKHLKLMSKHRQNLLKEKTIIKREKHLRLMSKHRQNLLKEKTIIKREKHPTLMSKHRQNLLKEKTIIKREKHLRLISKDRQNLLKEGTVIKGKKTLITCKL